ncbi:PQQ-binding-like beta-propeller repeat protein [Sulfidibacter corallicola]|uniref:PQQ-binding-like beta-propeller repeat protein n=1 Tax=Sulfidibacter corallicola TaxID=2818388 RepID=A0A8A4TII0_SULCO|nr:PQQ-binding-like beta-propeller repeat protein [Sulfidibacter corallicola]QTD48651.1 PQQ-binding-like beta-propeller repeat protein [Sulfidibacter corallicola]
MRIVFLAALCLASAPVPLLAQTANPSVFELEPGTLVDGAAARIYTMVPDGGIVALNLTDGSRQWQSDDAAKPVGLLNGHLAVYREAGTKIVFLDPETGREGPWTAASLSLPETAWTRVDDGLGRSLTLSMKTTDRGADLLWQSESRTVRARPPGPGDATDDDIAFGGLAIDAQNGQATAVSRTAPLSPSLRFTMLNEADRLPNLQGRQFLSIDGGAVLISNRIGDDRIRNKYRWTLYDRATGDPLGRFDADRSVDAFFVAGKTLVYVARPYFWRDGDQFREDPLRLRAIDLDSGRLLWERALRDTEYRGPFPP